MTILEYPHPLLKTRLNDLETIDDKVRCEASNMLLLCKGKDGVGLSANQVGLTYRMFVIPALEEPVCINPRIIKKRNIVKSLEGCLSIPGYTNVAPRYSTIQVEYYNLDGKPIKATLTNLPALTFQHELDHLNGILINDKDIIDK
jgi:peptide deformylase